MIVSPRYDAETRAPREPLPPGSCDCHLHVYGDPGKYPHRNPLLRWAPTGTLDNLQKMHAALGISRAVLVQPSAYLADHALLIDVLKAAPPSNYRGVAVIDDGASDADLRLLHEVGVRAARFNFWKDLGMAPDLGTFHRSIDRVRDLGWHIKVFASPDDLVELSPVLRRVKITAVLDHMAHLDFSRGLSQPACRAALELLKEENWWILLSNGDRSSAGEHPWEDAVAFGRAMYEAAPDRCIWGSDWPHLAYTKRMPNDADLVELLYRYLPDRQARQRVLVENPARLYGFG